MTKRRCIRIFVATLLCASLLTPLVPVRAQEGEKPIYKSRAEIPDAYKWKLDHIYPDQSVWEADVKRAEQLARDFRRFEGKLGNSAATLKQALDAYSELSRIEEKSFIYARLSLDVNAANPTLQTLSDRVDKMRTLVHEQASFVEPELTAVPAWKIKQFLAAKELAPYKMFIEEIMRNRAHTLSKDMESLLAQTSALTKVPENTYKMLSKDLALPTIVGEDGKPVQLTRSNYGEFIESSNREVRQRAFRAMYETYLKYRDTYAQTLAGEVRANNFYAKVRKYNSALEASLTPNDIPTRVYDELIQTVNAHLPLLHRYIALRKKWLGVEELHAYDMAAPLTGDEKNRYIPFDEAKQIVLDAMQPWGDDYVRALRRAFDEGWIDVYSTEDKRGGAYQWGAFDTHPYVLLNYQGTLDDVSTIAHELGHAMQSYYTNQRQPYMTAHYPIFTAEVASTMNETLMFKSLYAKAQTKQEKMRLLSQYLDNFRGTLFRQTQFAEFEKAIHEQDQAGESLNAEKLSKLYRDIHQKYYGAAMAPDEEVGLEWARIPHLYYGFYVYQYATSFAASTALANQMLTEGEPAVDRIKNRFLSAGSSEPPMNILKNAGVDMSTPQPIEQAMKVFEESLNEFERLLNEG